jgi:hypothetical protein
MPARVVEDFAEGMPFLDAMDGELGFAINFHATVFAALDGAFGDTEELGKFLLR